ncbi:hypothetical protein [Rhizobium laguerreae]|uniref:hypothetical protein n=1 Tax=Rhizobium laguerreae TaxID=1076926 RepID=UPI001FE91A60|nr:hypothetical protein [Rhizobium laguerreae]
MLSSCRRNRRSRCLRDRSQIYAEAIENFELMDCATPTNTLGDICYTAIFHAVDVASATRSDIRTPKSPLDAILEFISKTIECSGSPIFRSQDARDFACLLDVDPDVLSWTCVGVELSYGGEIYPTDLVITGAEGRTFPQGSFRPSTPLGRLPFTSCPPACFTPIRFNDTL